MPELSTCLTYFAPSRIGEVFNLAARLKSEGKTIYDLSTGEPDFATDPEACAAAHTAINDGHTKYTEVDGSIAMKEAVRRKFLRDGHPAYSDSRIIVSNGAKPLLSNILMTLLNPGDGVLIPTPCWTSHPGMVQALGAHVQRVPCTPKSGYKPDPENLRASITDRTKAMILCTPSNPTGAMLSEKEISVLADVLADYPHIWVVSDEIYADIVFDDRAFTSLAVAAPVLADRIITVNGVSKGHAMTGWRIGYAAGPEKAMNGTRSLMSHIAGPPSSISQIASIAVMNGPVEAILKRSKAYQIRRDMVFERLSQRPELAASKPEGAFYMFVDCSRALGKTTPSGHVIQSSADLTRYFLEHAGVAVVPGEAFECPGSFRLSFATSNEILTRACDGIIRACEDLT